MTGPIQGIHASRVADSRSSQPAVPEAESNVAGYIPVPVASVIRRLLDDNTKMGSNIKVFLEDEKQPVVDAVYRGSTRDGSVQFTRRSTGKQSSMKSGKARGGKAQAQQKKQQIASSLEVVRKELAFPGDTPHTDIIATVKTADRANEFDPLTQDVVAAILQLFETDSCKRKPDWAREWPTPEELTIAVNESEDLLAIREFGAEGVDLSIWNDLLHSLNQSLPHASTGSGGTAPESEGGTSKAKWATERLKKDRNELRNDIPDETLQELRMDLAATMHHKISRSSLKGMLAALNVSDPRLSGVTAMHTFLTSIKRVTNTGDDGKALKNWVANIEFGVSVDFRQDDPGSGFDGNYPSGVATPRTEHLEQASLLIDEIARLDSGTVPDKKWLTLAAELSAAQTEHGKMSQQDGGRGINRLSKPRSEVWNKQQGVDAKPFTRTKKSDALT